MSAAKPNLTNRGLRFVADVHPMDGHAIRRGGIAIGDLRRSGIKVMYSGVPRHGHLWVQATWGKAGTGLKIDYADFVRIIPYKVIQFFRTVACS